MTETKTQTGGDAGNVCVDCEECGCECAGCVKGASTGNYSECVEHGKCGQITYPTNPMPIDEYKKMLEAI